MIISFYDSLLQREGKGEFTMKDNSKLCGMWRNDMPDGEHVWTDCGGKEKKAFFKGGRMETPGWDEMQPFLQAPKLISQAF